jgi:hypothetical protein
VSNEIKDANLELLVGLRQHLDHAERLRRLLDRLLALAKKANDWPRPDRPQPAREVDRG